MQVNLKRAIGLLALLLSTAHWSAAGAGPLDESTFNKISVGKPTRFHDISTFDAKAVCLLQPYQDRLPSRDVLAARVNKYLAANNYSADEGHFAFVVIGNDAIELTSFKRSQSLDVLAKHEVPSKALEMFPIGFVPQNCADGQLAAFMKISFRSKPYIVLGELR